VLEIKDLVVKYGQAITAVDSVSIDVPEGRLVAIVGANGAGKTSLLSAVAGLGGWCVSPCGGPPIFMIVRGECP